MKQKMFADLKSCYHGVICHSNAENILMEKGLDKGSFLVWKIQENQGEPIVYQYILNIKLLC